MTTKKRLLTGAGAAVALMVPVAVVSTSHVRIEAPVVSSPPAAVVPVPAPTQTVQADEIKAGVVRANTIYANKIEADEVRGAVHQTRGVRVREISANPVEADKIYVRDLDRH